MPVPAIRIGDEMKSLCDLHIPECCPHSARGIVTSGSNNVFVNGLSASKVGDEGQCGCPHMAQFKITESDSTVFINGQPAARTKDVCTCSSCREEGNLLNGSDNVFFG